MLEKSNQSVNMAEVRKHKLSIHHSNLFHPKPLGITGIAWGMNTALLAITKEYIDEDRNQPLSILEIYRIFPNLTPKLLQTFIEYEHLTGIVWVSAKILLTSSKEQTISMYNVEKGYKVVTTITDYGSILCLKFCPQERLLLTGTEYGYVAAYKVGVKEKTIEPICKMVKINGKIQSIDFAIKYIENPSVDLIKPPSANPGKRKREDSSDEESDDEDDESKSEKFLASTDITIYGASQGNVIAWDYHKRTIIETMRIGDSSCSVLSILALKNGDIVIGDSTGAISIFDYKSFTCRQSTNVLKSDVLCLATNHKETDILISGRDPTIVIMKRDKTSNGEFKLFEKIELHTHDVTSLVFTSRDGFFSGGLDGFLVKFRLKKEGKKIVLEKKITLPHYSNQIKFSREEMMIQYDRSLVIWKLPGTILLSPKKNGFQESDQAKPVKLLLLKARAFIHSSTFSDKWISYSTKKGLHIFSRSGEKLTSYRPNKKLTDCSVLELCCDSRYLAVATHKCLYIIDLEDGGSGHKESEKSLLHCTIVAEHHLKSVIRQMMNFELIDLLFVTCSSPKTFIYSFDLNPNSKTNLEKVRRLSFKKHEISFMTYNGTVKRDSNIYVYTNNDQIIRFDSSKENEDELLSKLDNQDKIMGLPDDTNILGMIMVSKDQCILYDSCRMFKVDLNANKVINQNSDYNYIIRIDNFVFKKSDHIALVELTSDDYREALPVVKPKKKFGH